MIFRLETACVICVVILSHLRAWRSLILPNSTNTSFNHLLSSICTYANHFIKTQSKFFGGTFYCFIGELFSSCVIVHGSRPRPMFSNLKVVMNAASKNQVRLYLWNKLLHQQRENNSTTSALFLHWSSGLLEMSAVFHCTVTRDELILLKRLLSLCFSLYLDRILKQQLNIYWRTRYWFRVTMTHLFLWNFNTHGYGRFWLSYDLAENVLQRIKCCAQLNSSWIFFRVIQLRQILVLIFKTSSRLTVLRNRDWFTKHVTHVNLWFNAVKKSYISMRN